MAIYVGIAKGCHLSTCAQNSTWLVINDLSGFDCEFCCAYILCLHSGDGRERDTTSRKVFKTIFD